MKKIGLVVVALVLAAALTFSIAATAKEKKLDLENIDYEITDEIVGLKLNMTAGDIDIDVDSPNYSDSTNLQGEMDFSMIASAGELSQLGEDIDGSFEGVTKLKNGKFAVSFEGKAKKLFKQLLIEKAKAGEVTVIIKGDGEGWIIIITPSAGKRERRGEPTPSPWVIRFMQMKQALDLMDDEIWDILHEHGLIVTKHALENTPPGQGDESLWYFWLYLLTPEHRTSIEENVVISRFFHPETEGLLEDLRVNVSVRSLETDKGLVYASPMPYRADDKLYLEDLEDSNHWLIPPENLEPGKYMVHIDLGHDLRKYIKIPAIITDKGNLVKDRDNGTVGVDLNRDPDQIESVELSFSNTSDKKMSLDATMQVLKDEKPIKEVRLKSFTVEPDQQLANKILFDIIGELKEGEYTLRVIFETKEMRMTAEKVFEIS